MYLGIDVVSQGWNFSAPDHFWEGIRLFLCLQTWKPVNHKQEFVCVGDKMAVIEIRCISCMHCVIYGCKNTCIYTIINILPTNVMSTKTLIMCNWFKHNKYCDVTTLTHQGDLYPIQNRNVTGTFTGDLKFSYYRKVFSRPFLLLLIV